MYNFFIEAATQNLKVICFPTFSIHFLYKNDFTSNFSKFYPFPSLLQYLLKKFFIIWAKYTTYVSILGASQVMVVVKNIPANAGDRRRLRFDPQGRSIPCKRVQQHTPVFLPGESYGQRSLLGYSQQSCKEMDTTEVTQNARMHLYLTI